MLGPKTYSYESAHFHRNIPEIVHISSVQESQKFVNSVRSGGKKNISVSLKCSTGTEISVAFVGFEGRCHVFDVKSHPELVREGGLGELLEDGEVKKVGQRNIKLQKRHHNRPNHSQVSLFVYT